MLDVATAADHTLLAADWKKESNFVLTEICVFLYLKQCFPTFFGTRHHYVVLKIFCGTPECLLGIKIDELQLPAAPRSGITDLEHPFYWALKAQTFFL